jgi:hypothetical protein
MKVIRHQTECEKLDWMALLRRAKKIYKQVIVLRTVKNPRLGIAAIDDVKYISR